MTVYDVADVARMVWSRSLRWVMWSPARLLAVTAVVASIVITWAVLTVDSSGDAEDSILETSSLPSGWEQWPVVEVPANEEPTETTPPDADEESSSEADDASHHSDAEDHKDHEGHAEPDEATKDAATKAAWTFARAYTDVDRSRSTWLADVRRSAVDQLGTALKSVDPRNLEDITLRGSADDDAVRITSLSSHGGLAEVDTQPGPLLLNLTNTGDDDTWAVSRVTPPAQASE